MVSLRRTALSAVAIAPLIFGASSSSKANARSKPQIEVVLPSSRSTADLRLTARISNNSSQPITYCVDWEQTSPSSRAARESTPTPFLLEGSDGDADGQMRLLSLGPRVSLYPVVLAAGLSRDYTFQIEHGEYHVRLTLRYWLGAQQKMDCRKPPKHARTLRSAFFRPPHRLEE